MYDVIMQNMEPAISPEAIEKALELRGWSQAELSKVSTVSKGMITLIMQNKRENTSAVIMAKIAAALGCSIEFLMGLTDDPSSVFVDGLPGDPGMIELGRKIRQLTPDQRDALERMVDVLSPKPPRIIGGEE